MPSKQGVLHYPKPVLSLTIPVSLCTKDMLYFFLDPLLLGILVVSDVMLWLAQEHITSGQVAEQVWDLPQSELSGLKGECC